MKINFLENRTRRKQSERGSQRQDLPWPKKSNKITSYQNVIFIEVPVSEYDQLSPLSNCPDNDPFEEPYQRGFL